MSAIRNQNRFAEHAGKNLVTWRMLFETVAEDEKAEACAVEANEQNLDCLEAHLAKM